MTGLLRRPTSSPGAGPKHNSVVQSCPRHCERPKHTSNVATSPCGQRARPTASRLCSRQRQAGRPASPSATVPAALPALLHPLIGFPVYKGWGVGVVVVPDVRVCSSGLLSAHRHSAHSTDTHTTPLPGALTRVPVSGFKTKEEFRKRGLALESVGSGTSLRYQL